MTKKNKEQLYIIDGKIWLDADTLYFYIYDTVENNPKKYRTQDLVEEIMGYEHHTERVINIDYCLDTIEKMMRLGILDTTPIGSTEKLIIRPE